MEDQEYDLAVSFAGEQRDYVERVVTACKALGLRVFYDKDKNNDWWGGNFIREQRAVYSSKTRFFVPFISNEYLAKPIPMDEFQSAMMIAVKQGDGYILPVIMDGVQVPQDLLHPHAHYLRAEDFSPEALAQELQRKVTTAQGSGQKPEPIGQVVTEALAVRMPRVVPMAWSKYQVLNDVFAHLGSRFTEGCEQLRAQGEHAVTARVTSDTIVVRVERGGETVGGLDVELGKQMNEDHITWSVGRHKSMSNGFNGWATVLYDKELAQTVVNVSDFGLMARRSGRDQETSDQEDFFQHLWNLLIEQLER